MKSLKAIVESIKENIKISKERVKRYEELGEEMNRTDDAMHSYHSGKINAFEEVKEALEDLLRGLVNES